MKKQIIRMITLLAFSSALLLSSCSVEYRQRHNKGHDRGHDDHRDDHHYNRY